MKTCNKCKIEKPFSEFHKNKNEKYGYHCICKACKKIIDSERFQKNKLEGKKYNIDEEKRKQYLKEYKEKNRERISQWHKEHNLKNSEKLKKESHERYIKNKEKYTETKKIYALKNKEKRKEYLKEYNKKNREKINLRQKEYNKKRKSNDVNFKIRYGLRNCFLSSLKAKNTKKQLAFFNYVGIEIEKYIDYFKINYPDQFKMLSEKGKIHIDHIIPCKVYDFKNHDEIKLCWQPENLRLIDAKENMKKQAKIDFDLIKQYNIEHLLPNKLKR